MAPLSGRSRGFRGETMHICPACNTTYEDGTKFCPKDGTPLERAPEGQPSRVGQVIADRYRLVKRLGEGGMGEVYLAEHIYINKRVALKLLRPEIANNAEAVERFHREARATSSIGHENIITIDDFGRLPDGSVFFTMEYLEGEPLSELMLRGPLDPGRALEIVLQVCRGLKAAHEKGIVHRDIKPDNIFVTKDAQGRDLVKILDFGIAKVNEPGSSNLTRTGQVFGTPHYMSPEQAMGKPLDHRSDIYSVGVIMYEMFTGRVPFRAESFVGILTKHVTEEPVPPRQAAPDRAIHPKLEQVILKAMEKRPEHRYASMDEMLRDLQEVARSVTAFQGVVSAAALETEPPPPPPPDAAGGWTSLTGPAASSLPQSQASVPIGGPAAGPFHTAGGVATAPPSSSRAGMVVGLVAGLLVILGGGGAAWYFFLGPGADRDEDEQEASERATEPPRENPQAARPRAAGPRGEPRLAEPARPGRPGTRVGPGPAARPGSEPPRARPREQASATEVVVVGKPAGASVWISGRKVCPRTPCPTKVPPGGLEVELRLKGYLTRRVRLTPRDAPERRVRLVRRRVRRPPRRRRPGRRPARRDIPSIIYD